MKNLKLAFVALAVSAFMYACGSSESTAEQNQDTTTMMEEEEPMEEEEEAQPIMSDTETQSAATAGAASASTTPPPTQAQPTQATPAQSDPKPQQPAATTQQAPAASKPAAKPASTDPALIAQGKSLVENSDCRACHAVDSKLVGPSFKEVAERYQKDPKAVDMLAGKIIEGGAGNWGQIPMAPHPQISKGDATKMVQYVMSLNK